MLMSQKFSFVARSATGTQVILNITFQGSNEPQIQMNISFNQ